MRESQTPALAPQKQAMPGLTAGTMSVPGHGELSERGSGRPAGKRALITGGKPFI